MTEEQTANEVEYKMAVKLLNMLLQKSIISDVEYRQIDGLNLETFSPQLAKVYVPGC